MQDLLITTQSHLEGQQITENLGLVHANKVQCVKVTKGLFNGIKRLMGKHQYTYSELLDKARTEAINRLTHEAKIIGADAVIAFNMTSAMLCNQCIEVVAFGTAISIKR